MLSSSGTQEEFNWLVDFVALLFEHGFADRKAARVLREEWSGDVFGRWHASASGVPCTPPDNNALESFQNTVRTLLGGKPEHLAVLLPGRFSNLLQKELPERREKAQALSLLRVPWFIDSSSRESAMELIRALNRGVTTVVWTSELEFAVRAGDPSAACDITPEDIQRRREALRGEAAVPTVREEDFEGISSQERVNKTEQLVEEYATRHRAVHFVSISNKAMRGAPNGIEGYTCECKAWFDHGQCKHALAVAHIQGKVDLFGGSSKGDGDHGGRPNDRRPARVKQPHDSDQEGRAGERKRERPEDNDDWRQEDRKAKRPSRTYKQLLDDGTPLVPRESKSKTRATRPKEADRGRAKQRKNKGKSKKKGN